MNIGDKKIRVGVYGILTYGDKVLMLRTQSGSKLIYNFPGGGIDNGEGLSRALIRECKEEINIDVIIKHRMYTSKNLYMHEDFQNNYMFNIYYRIEIEHIDTFYRSLSIDGAKFFPVDSLPLNEMLPIDREFVSSLAKTTKCND